mgnify:CR=1 FL=1
MSQIPEYGIDDASQHGGLRFMLRAFKYRNYRLFFAGHGVSMIGTWIGQVTVGWLVYRLTGSPLKLGLVTFAGQIPVFLMSPLAGVMADRWDRRRALLVTETIALLAAMTLAVVTLTGYVTYGWVLLVQIVQGTAKAFNIPTRQALVVSLIEDKADLTNAIALNSSIVNGARLVGPSIAGVLIAAFGEGLCFLLDGLSFVFVLVSLMIMRLKPAPRGPRRHVLQDLIEGVRYAANQPTIRTLLLLVAVINLAGVSHQALLPIFAKDVLHGTSITMGLMMGATGFGALGGAVFLASRPSAEGLSRVVAGATAMFGISLLLLGWSTHLPLSLVAMAGAGFGMMMTMAGSNTVVQTVVDDAKRGRAVSLFVMATLGTAPLGGLIAGKVAALIGAPMTVLSGGLVVLGISAIFATRTGLLESDLAAAPQ